ncbi:MAG: ribonuclease P Rpr2/Rpp21/SNM1 subunit [Candidatus Micrarchaeia archaeon]|jgi:RNase P subunit RPR2
MAQQAGIREIVYERIGILLPLAEKALRAGDGKHAKRYVYLARKLSTRYNCRLKKGERMRFCKHCGMPRVHGINTSVRLRKRTRTAEYACSCGKITGFKY